MAATYSSRVGTSIPTHDKKSTPKVSGTLDGLEGLPVEILFDIYHHLDVESVFLLAQTNTLFYGLLHRNQAQVLLPILQRDFSPFHELLQVYTASDDDFNDHGGTFQPRRIVYRRYPGDSVGLTLSRGGMSMNVKATKELVSVLGADRPTTAVVLPSPRTAVLTQRDLRPLLKYCSVVRKWEELYPRLHWLAEPESCRILRDREREKLRRALYRWWLHARYFHGDGPRPRGGEPEPFVHDIRTSQMRMYSTSDLMELRALFVSVKNMIRHYIYPNLEQNMIESEDSTPLEQMIERSICERIVDTYAKLDPGELMFYFDNLYSYPRKRLVNDVNLRHPTFVHDQESLQAAIRSAVNERRWLDGIEQLEDLGSIVGDPRQVNTKYSGDGSADASIPAPGVMRRSRNDWSPPGDDGRALTERGHLPAVRI
ncbi:hypothetical protein BN1708_001767 [Verticillium longisporum]|uniref:F-box domain-containing protein n=1 Tax=Verticillium longisporum TaxID=100787 RepID=A0A0G4N520_VERLO|nr:hypothetical protein BN1708_001767 [Verticillium longisporum]